MRCWRASSRGPPAPRTDAADEGRDPYGEYGVCGVCGDCVWDCDRCEDEKMEDAYEDRDDRPWYVEDGDGYAYEHDGDGACPPRPCVVVAIAIDVLIAMPATAPGDDSAMLVSGRRYGSVRLSGRG